MKNTYEVRGDVTAIFLNSPKHGKMEALISTNKLQRADEFSGTWYAHCDKHSKSFYVVGNMPRVNGYRKVLKLHRWITNSPSHLVCDHINHDTLNNTDENLRLITDEENRQNRKGSNSNNTSGIRGVHWFKRYKKWRAEVKGKCIGYFDDIEDARIAVESARSEMMPYSKEAYLNAN